MLSKRKRMTKRALGLAVGSILAGLPTAKAAEDRPYGLYYDLRLSAGGGKTAQVTAPGDVVVMDLYAYITGANSDLGDDELQSSMGSFLSSNGGLLGDLVGLPPRSPFNSGGSSIGEQRDLDSDGDLDVGSLAATGTGYYTVRAGQPMSSQSASFYLGQVSFTVTGAANASTEVSYVPRPDFGALWCIDGEDNFRNGTDPNLHVGSPVKISYVGPVIDPGQIQYLSGTISGHISVSGAVRPEAGTTLILTKGLDVAAGGDFDTRDAQGGYGDHEVRIDDTTSGNAGGTLNVGRMYVGYGGTGGFTQSAGLTRIAADLGDTPNVVVGKSSDSNGTLDCTGGTLIAGKVLVGSSRSTGLMRFTGGNATLTNLEVGRAYNAGASVEVDGAGNLSVVTDTSIGSTGTGVFRQKGGSSSFGGQLKVGCSPDGGIGTIEVSGGTMSAQFVEIGAGGQGTFRQVGGRASFSSLAFAARVAGSTGTGTLEAGELNVGALAAGGIGSGSFIQTGGTLSCSGSVGVTPAVGVGAGRIELRGGRFTTLREFVGADPGGHGGEFLQSGGEHTIDWFVVHQAGKFTYSGGTLQVNEHLELAGALDFTNSPITLSLAANSFADFSKGTILNSSSASIVAGKFSLMNFAADFDPYAKFASIQTEGLIHIAGQPLVIPAAKAVYGSGTIEGDVLNQGLVSPGNSPGTLTVAGTYEQDKLAALHIELAGVDAESRDLLQITGQATLDGQLEVELLGDFRPAYDDRFEILAADSIRGLFANAPDRITFDQGSFDVLYTPSSVVLTHFAAVPEPSVAALLLLPAVLLRRRRNG